MQYKIHNQHFPIPEQQNGLFSTDFQNNLCDKQTTYSRTNILDFMKH